MALGSASSGLRLLELKITPLDEVFYTSRGVTPHPGSGAQGWRNSQLFSADKFRICSQPTTVSDKSPFHLSFLLLSFYFIFF